MQSAFRFIWLKEYAAVRFIQSAGVFTFFLSAALVGGAYREWAHWYNDSKITGIDALMSAGFVLCERIANGFVVSA